MNRFNKSVLMCVAALLFGAALMGAAAAADPAAAAASTDVSALDAVESSWVQAYNAGDANALSAFYADDAVLMPPGNPAAQGKQAIFQFFSTDLATAQRAGNSMSILGTPAGGVAGDWGWVSGAYAVTGKDGIGVESGKFLAVFKQVDGKWYILRETWSSNGK